MTPTRELLCARLPRPSFANTSRLVCPLPVSSRTRARDTEAKSKNPRAWPTGNPGRCQTPEPMRAHRKTDAKGPKSAGHHEQRRSALRSLDVNREALLVRDLAWLVSAMTALWPSPVPNRIEFSIPWLVAVSGRAGGGFFLCQGGVPGCLEGAGVQIDFGFWGSLESPVAPSHFHVSLQPHPVGNPVSVDRGPDREPQPLSYRGGEKKTGGGCAKDRPRGDSYTGTS